MDERLTNIQNEQQQAVNNSNLIYNDLLEDNKALYDEQKNFLDQQETTLNQNLDKQLEFQKQQIEQQKETAKQNFQTESKRALNDYTSFTNPYGYEAESMANNGLGQSGVSETAKLGGFNTYQNRLATASKAMQDAFVSYDRDLNEAILNNDVQKAENALAKLEQALAYTENYYSNKSTITQNQLNNQQALDSEYYGRYQDMQNQINYEKEQEEAIRQYNASLAEEIRQYNANMAYQKERDAIADAQWQKEYALAQQSSSKTSSSSSSSKNTTSSSGTDIISSNNSGLKKSSNGYAIVANPYTNEINSDAKYGVFEVTENGRKTGTGYQPNNVGGNKLSNSGMKVSDVFGNTAVGSSGINLSNQKIWTTKGKYYIWDGSANDYIDVTNEVTTSKKKGINIKWAS